MELSEMMTIASLIRSARRARSDRDRLFEAERLSYEQFERIRNERVEAERHLGRLTTKLDQAMFPVAAPDIGVAASPPILSTPTPTPRSDP